MTVVYVPTSEFDKIVVAVAQRRQAPELCSSIGLTHKMPKFKAALRIASWRRWDFKNLSGSCYQDSVLHKL
ncbi:hypothetical protein V6N11_023583 [Hibiscus sabdariffa]|uniref:Uncharacterized protein n=1 Tax=Hibiscus sabdariffa TaxID=183260 RepID=A0ABR2TMM9_9ROSI